MKGALQLTLLGQLLFFIVWGAQLHLEHMKSERILLQS